MHIFHGSFMFSPVFTCFHSLFFGDVETVRLRLDPDFWTHRVGTPRLSRHRWATPLLGTNQISGDFLEIFSLGIYWRYHGTTLWL